MTGDPALRCLWDETAAAPVAAPALAGPLEVETLVIGAGYTGLSTALHLAEAGREVALIEAGEPGSGASGRNGGQVIPGIRHFPDELIAAYGEELGRRIHAFGAGDADYTFALIERLGLACDAHRGGWIQAAENASEVEQGQKRVAAWVKTGAPVHMLDRDAFRVLTGTDAYIGGWIDERGGMIQPLSYARELARAAISAGAKLFLQTPAISISQAGTGWRVTTPSGVISAKKLLLATNAMTGGLHGPVARSQLTVWSYQIATRPLTAAERGSILPEGAVVSDTRRVLRYFRLDREARLVVGGKGKLSAPEQAEDVNLQKKMLETLYPEIAKDGFTHAWGGLIGITLDRLPRLFTLGNNAFAVLQDNGKGIAWCTAMGRPLAELLIGKDPRDLPLVPISAPQPIPFHALRKLYVAGGNLWLRFLDLRDRLR